MNTKQKMLLIPALVLLLVGVITVSAAAAPIITGVTTNTDGKNYGPAGTSVKVNIVGTGFTTKANTHVNFGAQNLDSYISSVNSGTIKLSGYPVPQPLGTVQVSVLDATNGLSNTLPFTFVGQPVVSAVNANDGPISGGTVVKITGSSFLGTSSVKFGTKAVTSFTVDSDNQITATVPAGANLGWVTVSVTNSLKKDNGNYITLTGSLSNAFEYYQGPVIYSVVPSQGPVVGGNEVIINGAGFTPGYLEDDGVMFGDKYAEILSSNDHSITVKAPAITWKQTDKPKTVDVQVTINGIKTAISNADKYTYIVTPRISAISTNVGKIDGGNTITLTGNGFTGISAVTFLGASSLSTPITVTDDQITFVSDTKIKVVVPPGYDFSADGYKVKLQVVSDGGTSPVSTAIYQYEQIPTITSIAPSKGTAGTKVTLILDGNVLGVPLLPVQKVMFGSVEATDLTVVSLNQITVVAPPQAAKGKVAVKLVTNAGSSTNNPKFNYIA